MPKRTDRRPAVTDFGECARWLRSAVRSRQGRRGCPPRRTTGGTLRLRCYEYHLALKKRHLGDQLVAFVSGRDGVKWKHSATDMGWVLRLIENEGEELLTPTTRMRVAAELDFADEHNVPAGRLLGFLYEAGGYENIRKFGDDAPSWLTRAYSEDDAIQEESEDSPSEA